MILLIVAVVIWAAAMLYMFKPDILSKFTKSGEEIIVKKVNQRTVVRNPENLTPDFIKDYVNICSEDISAPDPFTT